MNISSFLNKTFILPLLAICSAAITSCTDDQLLDGAEPEGTPVNVSIRLSLPQPSELKVLSRAESALGLQIYDLMVMAFDKNGNISQRYFFRDIDEGVTACDSDVSSDEMASLTMSTESEVAVGLLNMNVPAGSGYLMAVANVEITSTALLNQLMDVTTRDGLLALNARDSHYDSESSIMSGAYMEDTDVSISTFDPSGSIVFRSGTLPGKIHMLSTAASVKFNINGKGPASSGGTFTLDSYEFVNLPGSTPMFYQIGKPLPDDEVASHLLNSGELSVFEETSGNNYSFDFQMLEYKATGSSDIRKYGDRAAWDTLEGRYKHFTNAPDYAPYIILRGTYSGQSNYIDENGNEKNGNVSADVEYFIFLGHDSGTGTPEGLRDYSTLRNWQYTYNITINGINDITVEVNRSDDHWRDDVEGDVIVMDTDNSHRFDSHYCQACFSMTVGEIRELHNRGLLGFRVIVPGYGVDKEMFLNKNDDGTYVNENSADWGVHDENTGELLASSTDYYKKKGHMDLYNIACLSADWLRFYRHTDTEAAADDWLINYADKLKSVNGSNNPHLLTIYRFLWDLQSIARNTTTYNNTSKVIKYTVFVQENYYGNNWNDCLVKKYGNSSFSPAEGNLAWPNAVPSNPEIDKSVHWSQFVNLSDRKVLLFPVSKYSTDSQASYSNPRRVFAQRSIRTIYKPTTGFKAWGTESVEEYIQQPSNSLAWFKGSDWTSARRMVRIAEDNNGKPKSFTTNKDMSYTDSRYARKASFNALRGKNWTDYLNYNSKYLNPLNYRISGNVRLTSNQGMADMIAACLGRNRDINGDGKINPAEIRWYVPGISQLQALYVGNAGLPTEARLYQKEANEGKWVYKHYMSATRPEGDGSNQILWAEEGPSTGQMNSSYAYGLHVRCVRDLGTNLTLEEDEWSGFYVNNVQASGNAAGYIDIDKLNDNCIRLALENKDISGVVTTFNNANRPAKSFYYAKEVINKGYYKTFSYSNGKTYVVPDWTNPNLVRIDTENRKSEASPQRRSLCSQKFGQGWRTPTITEVAIMYWAGVFPRTENVLSRTRYTFWEDPTRGGIDLINNTGNDHSGRDPHSFSEEEFRLRYNWNNLQLPTTAAAGNITQISGHYGGILCVRDKL
ncbi:MAG: hypothetical protein K2M07_02825 [Muribaculaceae bacterium]|nr:hypothetical protein [Muribaculaceae bacterium]